MSEKTNKKVREFISVIRGSFHDASVVYTSGGCYGFYQIMKFVFPEAVAYFSDCDKQHIVVRIGDRYYDIDGLILDDTKDMIRVKAIEHERWEGVASGQTMQLMIVKMDRHCNKIRKPNNE